MSVFTDMAQQFPRSQSYDQTMSDLNQSMAAMNMPDDLKRQLAGQVGAQAYNQFYGQSGPQGGPVQSQQYYQEGMSQPITMTNPQMYSPGQLNPYASQYLQNINQLIPQLQKSALGGAFNPDFYAGQMDASRAGIESSMANQFARMGLAGSSAEMGGISNALNQNQMAWQNRMMSDQSQALRALEGVNQMGYGMATGVQNQYGQFEDAFNQTIANLYGAQQQKEASQNQMWGALGGGLLQGAAYALL